MIIPGILEETIEKVREKVNQLEGAAPLIQIDIADGIQVEGKTTLDIEQILRIETPTRIELHLMVNNPLFYLEKVKNLNRSRLIKKVSMHFEGFEKEYIKSFLHKAQNMELLTGISVNMETPIETLIPYRKELDFIQLLSVKPGKQGNIFAPAALKKVEHTKKLFTEPNIQVDGGVTKQNFLAILQAGADSVVIGSAIFSNKKPEEEYLSFVKEEQKWITEKLKK